MGASASAIFSFLLLLPFLDAAAPSPYLSATTLFQNYQNMIESFRIFIYTPPNTLNFSGGPASLFYNSLRCSSFITQDPDEAHLFFVLFSPDTSTRSLGRLVRDIRNSYPYWNRTLGADHFFLSPAGIDYSSDRNILELKKNSVQISVFPVTSGYFIPHKDITLPPSNPSPVILPAAPENSETPFLGYLKWDGKTESDLVNGLKSDGEFLVEERSTEYNRNLKQSKFCLFLYHGGDVLEMVEAMGSGCVPVVIVGRAIQDLPLIDVLRWSEMSMVVAARRGGGGAERLKELLGGVSEETYAEMRELGVAASKHLVWNAEPQPLDAFHMVMYQLWLRRHVIRYARRESA